MPSHFPLLEGKTGQYSISVNGTASEYFRVEDDEIKALPAISEVKQIGTALPALKGCYFFCKGTGKRMRDLVSELPAQQTLETRLHRLHL